MQTPLGINGDRLSGNADIANCFTFENKEEKDAQLSPSMPKVGPFWAFAQPNLSEHQCSSQ